MENIVELLGFAYLKDDQKKEITVFQIMEINNRPILKYSETHKFKTLEDYRAVCKNYENNYPEASKGYIVNENENTIDVYTYLIYDNKKILVSEYDKETIKCNDRIETKQMACNLVRNRVSSLYLLYKVIGYLDEEENKERRRTII